MKGVKIYFLTFVLLGIYSFAFSQKTQTDAIFRAVESPVVVIPKLDNKVEETSGLIFFRDAVWTLNDSGGKPQIYKLDDKTGEVSQTVTMKNVKNVDFEDITQDDNFIYVGDMGNNFGNRKNLIVYKIAKKDIPEKDDVSVKVQKIAFAYADQENFDKRSRQNDYDCEALMNYGEWLYLFTKNWVDGRTRMYKLSKTPGKYNLQVEADFNADGLITAAEYNVQKQWVVLLGYKDFMPFIWVFSEFNDDHFFAGKKIRLDLESIHGAQTEGICFNKEGNLLFSCEDSYFPQRLYMIPASSLSTQNLKKLSATDQNSLKLQADFDATTDFIDLHITGLKKGSYSVEILNQIWHSEKTTSFKAKKRTAENIKLSAKKFDKGLYYLRVSQAENVKVTRVYINK